MIPQGHVSDCVPAGELWSQSPLHAWESPSTGGSQAHTLPACQEAGAQQGDVDAQGVPRYQHTDSVHDRKGHMEEIQPSLSCALSE